MPLDTVELIMAIEKEFGINIPNHDAAKLETVGKISTYANYVWRTTEGNL